jgi:hypothetical protein
VNAGHLAPIKTALEHLAAEDDGIVCKNAEAILTLVELAGEVNAGRVSNIPPIRMVNLLLGKPIGDAVPAAERIANRLIEQILARLATHDIVPIQPVIGETFDMLNHRCTERPVVNDPALNDKVVEVEAVGLKVSGRVYMPAFVKLGIYGA